MPLNHYNQRRQDESFINQVKMSCNGCRILRKGCSENCILRPCIQWLETPEAQANATLFVAKFFGRAGLVSFLSAVPLPHRPALFQSLLYEACGRTVNPVTGAIGLLSSGNWHLCQAAVDTVLNSGSLRPIPQFLAGPPPTFPDGDDVSEVIFPPTINHILPPVQDLNSGINSDNSPPARFTNSKRRRDLTPPKFGQKRPGTPSEESVATISFESQVSPPDMPKLLNLFV